MVVSCFNLHCPDAIFVEHLLICLFVIHIVFSEVSLKVYPPFFFFITFVLRSILSDMSIANLIFLLFLFA